MACDTMIPNTNIQSVVCLFLLLWRVQCMKCKQSSWYFSSSQCRDFAMFFFLVKCVSSGSAFDNCKNILDSMMLLNSWSEWDLQSLESIKNSRPCWFFPSLSLPQECFGVARCNNTKQRCKRHENIRRSERESTNVLSVQHLRVTLRNDFSLSHACFWL